jgi:hypothetical protein
MRRIWFHDFWYALVQHPDGKQNSYSPRYPGIDRGMNLGQAQQEERAQPIGYHPEGLCETMPAVERLPQRLNEPGPKKSNAEGEDEVCDFKNCGLAGRKCPDSLRPPQHLTPGAQSIPICRAGEQQQWQKVSEKHKCDTSPGMENLLPSPRRLDDEKKGLNHSRTSDIGIRIVLQSIFLSVAILSMINSSSLDFDHLFNSLCER